MRSNVGLAGIFTVAAALLAGCGGSSTTARTPATTAIAGSPAAAVATPKASGAKISAVAYVDKTPIPKTSYEHWLAVETAGGVTSNTAHRALGFLITSDWMLGEAAAQHVSVTEAEVSKRLAQVEKQSFPKAGALQKFLAKSGETKADLLAIVRVELLKSRIVAKVSAGKSGSSGKAALASFERAFQPHWKALTTCDPGYVMEDCSEYTGKGKEPNLTATDTSTAASGGSATRSSSSSGKSSIPRSHTRAASASGGSTSPATSPASATSNSSGELPEPRAGELALSSSAFERNGEIPKQYTCDGAGTSPPLEWSNVPAKAKALVLFVIDVTSGLHSPASGIRWVVGDINPKSTGVAAGQTPEEGIVGSDTQGHSGYGGICPEPGKTSTIEFQLYALSEKISLLPGFTPSVAESEYGGHNLILSNGSATTYATYTRP
jgi:phosphatidylethanolamine-binding protein (PEBP) family uncharacterized protein